MWWTSKRKNLKKSEDDVVDSLVNTSTDSDDILELLHKSNEEYEKLLHTLEDDVPKNTKSENSHQKGISHVKGIEADDSMSDSPHTDKPLNDLNKSELDPQQSFSNVDVSMNHHTQHEPAMPHDIHHENHQEDVSIPKKYIESDAHPLYFSRLLQRFTDEQGRTIAEQEILNSENVIDALHNHKKNEARSLQYKKLTDQIVESMKDLEQLELKWHEINDFLNKKESILETKKSEIHNKMHELQTLIKEKRILRDVLERKLKKKIEESIWREQQARLAR
ncbi:MAG: hypothetical protein ACMXYE_03910 [Candidatus Woesearchaeota archaeon]